MAITYPYWNNDEVISSDKLNSMVQAIINGDPLAVKVSNATKNDVNQIVSYLSSLHDSAKTNLNSATSTSDLDTAYTNMRNLVSNKTGFYANDDTVDLYSTGIRASIITFLQAYDSMMSKDRLNNKNTDNTLNGRIDSEAQARSDADTSINNNLSAIKANGGGRNLLTGTQDWQGEWRNLSKWTVDEDKYKGLTVRKFTAAWWGLGQYYDAEPNTTYTFSFYAKASETGNNMDIFTLNSDNWSSPVVSPPVFANRAITTEWQRYSVTFTTKSSGKIYPSVCSVKEGITIYVAGYMLETGIVAHDWLPAPEDVETEITSLDGKTMQNRGTVNAPDFNSLTQTGYYTITNPMGGKNYPSGSLGTLEVSGQVADTNGRLNQKYVSDSGGTIYTRQYNAGTKVWTPWVQMANTNDVDTKINSLQIGGRNLLRNSDKLPYSGNPNDNSWSTGKWRMAGLTTDNDDMRRVNKEITDSPCGKAKVISYTGTLRSNTSDISLVAINNVPISGNVTVSFWARQISSVDTAFVSAGWSNGTGMASMVNTNASTKCFGTTTYRELFLPKDGSWTRFWGTFNVDNNGNVYIGAGNTGTSAEIQICLVKIETGTTATDWTPAPEDFDNYNPGRTITFPNNSSITLKGDRIIPHINLPVYLTDNLWTTDLNNLATSGEYDNAFIPSATMATLTKRPTNPDTKAPLTGDCFYTAYYAYSGTTVRAFQKIYSCDYNYTFTRSYNGSSGSWGNWSCLTPYA